MFAAPENNFSFRRLYRTAFRYSCPSVRTGSRSGMFPYIMQNIICNNKLITSVISTMKIDYITTINKTFTNNRIAFREIDCRNGILYLCETSYGQTFNFNLQDNNSVKIWSFVGTASIDKAGTKCEWKSENDLYPIGGIEITDDGDLNFYMTDILTLDEPTGMVKVKNMITIFVTLFPLVLSRFIKM